METELGALSAMSGGVMVENCMAPLKYLRADGGGRIGYEMVN
jgi:hypothetical protein